MQNSCTNKLPISLKVFIRAVLFLLLLVGISFADVPESGRISGLVLDKSTDEPLPGANVFLEGTTIGASTNVEGEYFIVNVPPGTYNITVKYIGYKDVSLPVTIKEGEKLIQNIKIEYVAIEGETIEITAQAEGQIEAINQQLASNTIKNVVSADRIQDIPDANAAESVSRLPGISLKRSGGEGQKVTIRGLSPKYNVMMVNGVRMQSTDRDDRSVDLNMISPNALSGIEVTKALTADMDADAVGGTVNLKTGKAKEGFHSKFAFQNGYGSLAETYGNYRLNGLLGNRFFDNKLGIQLTAFLDNNNRNSDVLNAFYDSNRESPDYQDGDFIDLELVDARITDRITDRKRLGAGLVFDYEFSNGSLVFNNFISNLSEDQTEIQNTVTTSNGFSAYATISELSNTVFNNALQGEFKFSNIGLDFSLSSSVSKQYRPGDLRMNVGTEQGSSDPVDISIDNPKQASPAKFLNAVTVNSNGLRVQNFNTLKRDVTEAALEGIVNFNIPFTFTNYLSGNFKFGGKYVNKTRENDETQWFNTPDRNHIGELFVQLLEDSLWTDLGLAPEDRNLGIRAFLFEDKSYDIGDFLSGKEGISRFFYKPDIEKMKKFERLARSNTVTENGITYPAYPIEEQPSAQYDYDYNRNQSAFYIQTDLKIGNYVTLYPGIRYENYNVDYTAFFTERYGPSDLDFRSEKINVDSINVIKGDNWFPQIQLRIKPLDWLDIRLASTKSIIYPDYRAISPYRYFNSFGSVPYLLIGNPFLKPAISQNYDIYTSVYDNYIGLFTAGFFYKEVDNLIYSTGFKTKDPADINNLFPIPKSVSTDIDTWVNLKNTAYVRGFELDWQTHFWYLPDYFKGLVFNINFTHINSKARFPFQTATQLTVPPFTKTFVDSSRTGRLIDQPNDILNATLGYDIGGFSVRLSFLLQDDVIVGIDASYDEKDIYTDAYYRWDLTALQKLPWYDGLQVYLNINNITNEPDRHFRSVRNYLDYVEYYGMTADLGIRYEF